MPITLIVVGPKPISWMRVMDPMAASIPVIHVPTFAPRIMAMAAGKVIRLLTPRHSQTWLQEVRTRKDQDEQFQHYE